MKRFYTLLFELTLSNIFLWTSHTDPWCSMLQTLERWRKYIGVILSDEHTHSGPKCWTLDSGRSTLDYGLWTLDPGWTLDTRLWILDSRHWSLDARLWTLDSGRSRQWTLFLTGKPSTWFWTTESLKFLWVQYSDYLMTTLIL